ncbi:uncharacterized protein C3orf14 homolog isoform X3 [Ictalurus furcatus]|uniref:uncharacterized protein C3orf14 homolog isoform X3 n=1 Tax=Ictalurus furcatus TaxID=66913 RepID=UPI0023505468|nr:uncharacterized protein C3orf14 homolog isoform X3 [Ictalurus furcatus]
MKMLELGFYGHRQCCQEVFTSGLHVQVFNQGKMASNSHDELQLSKKHEEILGKRAVLLQQMEICYEQQKAKRNQQATMSQAALERNAEILEDFQKVEKRLWTRPLLHPDVLNLQGHGETWSLSQGASGTRRGTPWTRCQSIAGHNHTHTHTPIHTLWTL